MASAEQPDAGTAGAESAGAIGERPALEAWAGVECSRVRVGRRIVDQLTATGHRERAADIDRLVSLAVSAVRYPVLWEDIAPRGLAAADWSWPDERLAALRRHGIRPVVGLLHHGAGPPGMSLLHPGFAAAFARYAAAVARRYEWIDTYVPINEPLTTARFAGLYGWWHPHARSEEVFARLLLAQCRAIRAATRAIKAVNPRATIIVNDDVGRTFATPPLALEAAYLNGRRWLSWDVLFGRLGRGHPLHDLLGSTPANARVLAELADDPEPPDVLGIDHYVTSDRYLDHRVGLYAAERRDPLCPAYVDVEASRVRGVAGKSVARAIGDTWRRYGRPMVIAETGLAGAPADQVAWWNEAWAAAAEARRRGVDIRAVTAWAVFGAVDWHCTMRRAEDLYEAGAFDVRAAPIERRPLADAIRAVTQPASAEMPVRPTVDARGWWRRRDRFELSGTSR